MSNKIAIRNIAKVTNGKSDVKDAIDNGKYVFFDRSNLIKKSDKYLFDSDAIIIPGEDSRQIFEPRYFSGKFNLHQRCYVIYDFSENFFPKFLFYKLKTLTKHFANVNVGSTVPSLRLDHITDLKIDFPNYASQKSIAKVLSDLDAKIELNNRINRELEAMAKTLYDYWFVQFDFPNEQGKPFKSSGGKMVYNAELKREIPEGWEVGTVEDYCRIFTGKKDVNQSLEIGKYKFFSCAPGYKYSDEKLYEGKAILVSGNGSYTGRTIFVDEGFDLYQRTYACVNKTETDYLAYIYYSMLRYMSLKINGGTHGSAIPYIVFDDIAKEIIVINHNLINKFQNIVYPLINKIMNNNKQAVELAKHRDWLLPMLMNGQVTVGDSK